MKRSMIFALSRSGTSENNLLEEIWTNNYETAETHTSKVETILVKNM